ncbi:hypothetical protein EVAR_56690_1 [Eumeta japonica]|uniref:Uncharacterized protein n=1 Tax=Eumeta variegata TaxID=151549 RepID=A0A4C1ZYH6_EUMVA|nr:hypothetical protein EVAR_56690_1 [Eumeta japonica]
MASVTPYFLLLISVSFFKLISSSTVYHEGDQYEADPSYARATMTNATARAGGHARDFYRGAVMMQSYCVLMESVFNVVKQTTPLHLVGSVDGLSRRVPDALRRAAGASRRRTGAAARALGAPPPACGGAPPDPTQQRF